MVKLFGSITIDFNQLAYQHLDFVPFYLLIIAWAFFSMYILLQFLGCQCKKLPLCLLRLGYMWLSYALRQNFKETKDGIVIGKYKFHKRRAPAFGFMLIFIILFCVEIFWDIFLLSESADCTPNDDEKVDCFFRSDKKTYNCSSAVALLGSNTNYTSFLCYKFVWNLSGGISAVGGTLTACALCTAILISFYESLYDHCKDKRCMQKRYELRRCPTIFQVIIIFLSYIGVLIGLLLAIIFLENPYVSTAVILNIVSLLVILIVVSFVCHCYGEKTQEAIDMEKANENIDPDSLMLGILGCHCDVDFPVEVKENQELSNKYESL